MRKIRFAFSGNVFAGTDQLVDAAVRAEAAGFDVFTIPDLPGGLSPLVALTAVARATSTIHVSPFVLNSGIWNPATLVRELATVDQVNGGRLEIALGSGSPVPPVAPLMPDSRDGRFDRLRDTVATVKQSFEDRGITPGYAGRPPVLVAGTTARVQRLAAEQADGFIIAGVPPVPKVTLPRGQQVLATREATAGHIARVRELAGSRSEDLEIGTGVVVVLTDDREKEAAEQAAVHSYLSVEELLASPKIAVGNAEQISEHLLAGAELGLDYQVLRGGDPDSLAPALARVRAAQTA